ncbi:MAG: acetoin utilization protein AcuC [Mariprofundaceae bacterium]|nr:acetoin utilization protein AcuC [Mariprofundaceae bacterium]
MCLYCGEVLGRYAFGPDHPFGPLRLPTFMAEAGERGLLDRVCMCSPVQASKEDIARFHSKEYIERVRSASESGLGVLDAGDTPAFPGIYEAAATVSGSVLDAVVRIMDGRCRRAFVPIADVHEDGRYLYPGSGFSSETGKGDAKGSKLNISMPPGADDAAFLASWEVVETFITDHAPQFIIFQCGADSLENDPITHLAYSPASHRHAARRLCELTDKLCEGRLLALGGGGYQLENLSAAWCAVVEAMLE